METVITTTTPASQLDALKARFSCIDRYVKPCYQSIKLQSLKDLPVLYIGIDDSFMPPKVFFTQYTFVDNVNNEMRGVLTELISFINLTQVILAFKKENRLG